MQDSKEASKWTDMTVNGYENPVCRTNEKKCNKSTCIRPNRSENSLTHRENLLFFRSPFVLSFDSSNTRRVNGMTSIPIEPATRNFPLAYGNFGKPVVLCVIGLVNTYWHNCQQHIERWTIKILTMDKIRL